jgi:hypothetical protein
MESVQERLEREYGCDLIVTAPSVVYKCEMNDGEMVNVDAPGKLVDADQRTEVQEPYVAMEIVRAPRAAQLPSQPARTRPRRVGRLASGRGARAAVRTAAARMRCERRGRLRMATRRLSATPRHARDVQFCPKEYSGTLMELAQNRRGEYVDMKFLTEKVATHPTPHAP